MRLVILCALLNLVTPGLMARIPQLVDLDSMGGLDQQVT